MNLGIIARKVIIILQITNVMTYGRKKSIDDSLETIFYFKESRSGTTPLTLNGARSDDEDEMTEETTTPPAPTVSTLECKWCVNMCCGQDCVCADQAKTPSNQTTPKPTATTDPTARRFFTTRDYIKNVLTHDGDISTILNDLVRVTLQKVDILKKKDRSKRYTDDSQCGF